MANLKGGVIVTLRLNPQDVMAAIDIVDKAGMHFPGMSISQCVKIALEGMFQASRNANAIPVRDGFEYEDMISRFTGIRQGRKLEVTRIMEAASVSRAVFDKPHALVQIPTSALRGRPAAELADDEFDQLVIRKASLHRQIEELEFKQRADPHNFDASEQASLLLAKRELLELDQP